MVLVFYGCWCCFVLVVRVDVAGCSCWICYLGVVTVVIVGCCLYFAVSLVGDWFGVCILCRCFDLDALWLLR